MYHGTSLNSVTQNVYPLPNLNFYKAISNNLKNILAVFLALRHEQTQRTKHGSCREIELTWLLSQTAFIL